MSKIFDDCNPLIELIRKAIEGAIAEAVEAEWRRCCKHATCGPCRDAILNLRTPKLSAPEPMTVATMIAKLAKVSNQNWHTIRQDLEELVQAARDKGFDEGFHKGFREGGGHPLKDSRREPAPPPELMTIAKLMDWFNDTGCGELELSQVESKLILLVREQARRDVDCCIDAASGTTSEAWATACETCRRYIAKSAGLE